ncbi:citrate/2-methylcitrate synthase [Halocatena halophila]|uniref:citrate/2-methylcitrate synthase n=1 Tax=Halocatena halophila TaxID=2814576 RepID=UPI002ED16111
MTPSIFDPGLTATAIAETSCSDIDADGGTFHVRGYPIEAIATKASYEEATWLLRNGRLPTTDALESFRTELANRRSISEPVHSVLETAAQENRSVMEALRMGLATATVNSDDTLIATSRVVAICPTIVTAYWQYREGGTPIQPHAAFSHTANIWYMLTGMEPDDATVAGLETYLTTIIEHGVTPSTFAARIVGSTGADPFSAATAAVGALTGPRHGGALTRIHAMFQHVGAVESPTTFVERRLTAGESIPGFGHSVYTGCDQRTEILKQCAKTVLEGHSDTSLLEAATALETAVHNQVGAGAEHPRTPNVDFYAVVLLDALAVSPPLFPAMFAIGRTAGWMAHYLEQLESETLLRPRSQYDGPKPRSWVSRADRDAAISDEELNPDTLAELANAFELLSEPSRLELLAILDQASKPLSYSAFRERSSIQDKGRFNYHLRRLRGTLIANVGATYTLRAPGQRIVERLLDGDITSSVGQTTDCDGEA